MKKIFWRGLALSAAMFAASVCPVFAQNYGPTEAAMQEGMAAYYAGDWDACIAKFESVLNETPQDTLALAYILDASFRKNNVDGVINKYELAYMASGEAPAEHAQLGLAYFLRGLINRNALDDSLTEFQGTVRDDPNCSLAYTGIGMVYFQKRMMPQSKGYFVRGLRLNPHDVMAMDRLGNIILVDEKKPAEALEIYERIVQELPTYPDGHYFMGSALYDLGRYEEALPYLRRCAELDPKGYTQGYDAITLGGEVYMKLDRMEEAKAAFEHALTLYPESNYCKYKLQTIADPSLRAKPVPKDDRRASVLTTQIQNNAAAAEDANATPADKATEPAPAE